MITSTTSVLWLLLSIVIVCHAQSSHPGTCPRLRPDQVGICVEECTSDVDCARNEKCCSNGCGHTCQQAVTSVTPNPTPGRCPPLSPGQVGACVELCRGDAECGPNSKCCSNGCGHTCQRVTTNFIPTRSPEHPGSCPPLRPGQLGVCVERCRSDADCAPSSKCCSNGCGHTCKNVFTNSVPNRG